MAFTKKQKINDYGVEKEVTVPDMPKIISAVVVGLIVLILLLGSFGTVGAGERGVRTRFGAVVGEVGTGLYLKIPFVEHVYKMDVQTQKEQTDASAASSDLQNVSAKVAINYNVDPSKVAALYTNIGEDYKAKVIDPAIQEAVKAATAKYTAEHLITERPQVQQDIQAALVARLSTQNITVSAVSIVNFDFSNQFNQAIEAKVTAEQNALAAKNKLDQIKYEAEQKVTTAEAEAKAIQLQSQAANNEKYISLKALDVEKAAIDKWDGRLPTQMIPGQTLPFINVSK